MDFRNRGQQPSAPHGQPAAAAATSSSSTKSGKRSNWYDRGIGVMLLSGALLLAALAFLLSMGNPGQARAVNEKSYQAVFLNNGQVYFGNIKNLNEKFIDLQNIYYLQTSGTEAEAAADSNNVSLVKLGCELHAPFDQMVINYDQVIFWENLQDSSQVSKAIADYKKNNPNGQTCSTASQNSTQQAPATNTPAAAQNPTGSTTTPAATAPAAKKP